MPVGSIFAIAVTGCYALVLAVTVGHLGLSRAVSVDAALLASESAFGLVCSAVAAAALAFVLALRMGASGLGRVAWLGWVIASDVAQALVAIAVVGELTLAHLPVAITVVTGLGTQLVAIAPGVLGARRVARGRRAT